ncbi:MAG TPA: 2-polyprenylphenol 6-hydroxylase [Roseiarcus sp.]|nr:2-polyprenylphenol 6-hydroxylase [Roseiarcus sp.]
MSALFALGHSVRLARAGFVLAREGAFLGVDPRLAPPPARPLITLANFIARRDGRGGLAAAIDRLGPSYVKLGQFLSTRPDIVGPKVVAELELLQDRMAPFPRSEAVRTIEAAFGVKLESLFAEFGEPVAAASIAQVHRATIIEDGATSEVAVKVLRPGVERRFSRDLSDMFFAARLAERVAPEARRLRLLQVVETLARSVRIEMDFRLEAAAASEFAENVEQDEDFHAPKVDWARTAREVLTLEWIEGLSLHDPDRLMKEGFDTPAVARTLIQSFLRHALRDGFFHADMHQGNLFIDSQGRIAAIDFGIMGRLGLKERRFLAEILYGFITRNYRRVAEVHFEAGYVPKVHRVEDFAQAIRAIGEPIHSRTADQISMAKLLTLLFEVTALFDMATRIELVMLQKTMVVVEGVARRLDPRLNMWATAEPVVGAWIAENLGPRGRIEDLGRAAGEFARLVAAAPERIDRLERAIEALPEADRRDRPAPNRSGLIALALWAIAIVLAIIAFQL